MKAIIHSILMLAGFILTNITAQAQVPSLSSYPSAAQTIYLDFDGQYISGTSWNWSGAIKAEPSGITPTNIIEIFNRVAEDYRPFNINITTDSNVYAKAPFKKRVRIIITPTSSWYGRAGGVAFVNSFSWGDDTPAWVFSALLNNNTKWVAEACSHEAGHTLGLQHQSAFDINCRKTAEYNEGKGEGEIGWAPIMGVGYYKNLTTWHIGSSTSGCGYIQNDLQIISSRIGFREDDHSERPDSATHISITGGSFAATGLINQPSDIDAFQINLSTSANFKLNAIPENVGYGNDGADIDIKVAILNANLDTIGIYNPTTLLNAGIDTNLNRGIYYLMVKGVGNINHSEYGSLGFYSLSGSLASATDLAFRQFLLKGNTKNENHLLNWSYNSDLAIKSINLEVSVDGKNFSTLISLPCTEKSFSYSPMTANSFYYRLKAVTAAEERVFYSNIIILKQEGASNAVIMGSLVQEQVVVKSNGTYSYRLYDATGKLFIHGSLEKGLNAIDIKSLHRGLFFMQLSDGVHKWTEKLLKQ